MGMGTQKELGSSQHREGAAAGVANGDTVISSLYLRSLNTSSKIPSGGTEEYAKEGTERLQQVVKHPGQCRTEYLYISSTA